MADIVEFPGNTVADLDPSELLDKAQNWGMEHCIVIGHDEDGRLLFGGTTSNMEKVITLLRRAELWSLKALEDE